MSPKPPMQKQSKSLLRPEPTTTEDKQKLADPVEVRRKAMDLLARREHSHLELEHKLSSRGMDAEIIHAVLIELKGDELLDDDRFAESFVSHRVSRGQGPVRIREDLKQRGVQGEHVEILLRGHDWLALARDVRRQKFGGETPHEFSERARQARFLTYLGFTSEQAMAALGGEDD